MGEVDSTVEDQAAKKLSISKEEIQSDKKVSSEEKQTNGTMEIEENGIKSHSPLCNGNRSEEEVNGNSFEEKSSDLEHTPKETNPISSNKTSDSNKITENGIENEDTNSNEKDDDKKTGEQIKTIDEEIEKMEHENEIEEDK